MDSVAMLFERRGLPRELRVGQIIEVNDIQDGMTIRVETHVGNFTGVTSGTREEEVPLGAPSSRSILLDGKRIEHMWVKRVIFLGQDEADKHEKALLMAAE